ncbi:MAG: enoyl-CoA hydratase/isomerase family protein [Burkholderiaceae bacterium]
MLKYLGPNDALGVGSCLKAELEAGVLTIVLDSPQHRNTINGAMALAMQQLFTVAGSDDEVRCLVLGGSGPDFFVDFAATTSSAVCNEMRRALRQLPQPVMAMVHGACHPDAIELLESCDIVICADDATFNLPCSSPPSIDAQEAQRQGLVTLSVPALELQAQTYQLARELASKDALALRFTKQTLQCVPKLPWDEVLDFTTAQQAELHALQAGRPSARALAVESFLAGKSKPGAGG